MERKSWNRKKKWNIKKRKKKDAAKYILSKLC